MSNAETIEHMPPAVVTMQSGGQMPIVSEAQAMVSMIERAARDPAVNIDKLERLIALQDKMRQQRAEEEFAEAMSAAQSEMRAVAADANNPQTRSRYASYFALDRAMRPIYTKHGLSLSFNTVEGAPDQQVRVLCYVSRGGFTRTYQVDMPADGKGAKGGDVMTKMHATGAAFTYGQRYLLKLIFNIAVGDDDDGRTDGNGETIDASQVEWLQTCIVEVGADLPKFLKFMKVEHIGDIPKSRYSQAIDMLNRKKAQEAKHADANS